MAKDIKLLAEAYMGIYEAGTATGMENVKRMQIDNLKKQLQAIDATLQSDQQRWQAATPQQRGYMKGFNNRQKYNQDRRTQIVTQLSKIDPQFAATQAAGKPATAQASAATQQQDASALLKATTPRAAEFGETPDGAAQPGTFTPTAAPQIPSRAAAQALPGATPAATAPQGVAKASGATQQAAPSTARYIPRARVGGGGRLPGRKPDWASK